VKPKFIYIEIFIHKRK